MESPLYFYDISDMHGTEMTKIERNQKMGPRWRYPGAYGASSRLQVLQRDSLRAALLREALKSPRKTIIIALMLHDFTPYKAVL